MNILNLESGIRTATTADGGGPAPCRAGMRVLIGGCVHSPRHAPAPVPAAAPVRAATISDGIPTTSVDLSRTAGDNTTFHETATERQKFQVHIDFGKIFDARGDLDRAVQEYQDALKVAEARGHRELTAADRGPGPSPDRRRHLIASGDFPRRRSIIRRPGSWRPGMRGSGTTRGIALISRDAGPTPSARCGPR